MERAPTIGCFPHSRQLALARWENFLPQLSRYAARRNFVDVGHQGVTRLSPAIRHRLLTEEELVQNALARYSFPSIEKFVQEVLWRTYWKGWLEMRPQVWRTYRNRLRQLRNDAPAALIRRAQRVASGRSGVAVMDHFARELVETGYLHNHARMWWASFWVHVERLPWELGADFFFRHLLDADPGSNTLSWRWVAGLQTRGKSYLVRRSNLERFCSSEILADQTGLDRLTDGRIQPVEIEDDVDTAPDGTPTYAATVEPDSKRIGIWIHADDASIELSALRTLRPVSVAAITSRGTYDFYELSEARQSHLVRILRDGFHRATLHFNCHGEFADSPTIAAGLVRWAAQQKLDSVIALAPFVGPIADAVPGIREKLDQAGVALQLARRDWDAKLFPHARTGYFRFWHKAAGWLKSRSKELFQPELKL